MFKYLYKHKLAFFLHLLILFINELTAISCAFILKYIIDAVATLNVNILYDVIKVVLVYFVIVFLVGYSRRMIRARYLQLVMEDLKNDLFNGLINNKISTFMDNNTALYISIFNNDLKIIEEDYFSNFFNIVTNIYTYVIAITFMIFLNPIIALSSVILSVLPLFLPSIFGKKLSKLRQDHLESIEMYNIKIKDFFSGFELIKSFNIDSVIKKNHSKANKEVENRKYGYNSSNAFVDALSNILSVFMQFAVFLITGFLIIMKNLSIGTMSAAMQLCGMTVYPVRSIVESLTRMKSAKYVNKKVLDLINVQEEKGKGLHVDQLKACIEFKNVSFAYNDKNVLNNLNFKLEKGKKYAIVGASGSGKSTLAKLLLGYYENYNGDILLDNHDIRKINVESISKIFSIIHQNVFIFEDSLKNNITLYNNYDEAKIEKSIHAAGLNKFIETLNDGMKTHIDENGKKLSGGEKQRIAIARAIVTGSNVLILDEATANLDNEIAYNIENSLLKTKDLTSIVITHRLNKELLAYYDQILVFKNGEICEHGSFNELINKKEYFYSLYKIAN